MRANPSIRKFLLKFRKLLVALLVAMPMIGVAAAAPNVGGTVFREFKVDGTAGSETSRRYSDLPMNGVGISIYGEDGSLAGTTTTQSDGTWTFDVGSTSGSQVLVEFEIPTGFSPGPVGADNGSAVVIANKGATGINFTLANPSDHSEDDPTLAASCFVTSQNPGDVTLVSVRYGDTKDYGTSLTGQPMGQDDYPQKHYATNRSLYPGAQKTVLSTLATSKNINGIAWNRRNAMVYGGVYHKWQIDVNIGQMGKIFATDLSGGSATTSEWLDLHSVFGSNVTGTYTGSNAAQEKAAVGYIGITDVDISDDARTLFAFNARTLEVYAIPIAEDGSANVSGPGDIQVFQIPRPAAGTFTNGGQTMPRSAAGGLGFNNGRVYATATITGPTFADMRGVLYSFDPNDNPATTLITRELEIDYSGWQGNDVLISGGLYGSGGVTQMSNWKAAHPVNEMAPWFFDIAFDIDASGVTRMTLGTRNRSHEVIDPDELYIDPTRGGYAHRAFHNGSGWVLESNGAAGSLLTGLDQSGPIYARTQPNTRFYHNEGLEGPMMHGTFAVVPGFKEVAGMATDNMFGDWDSGVTFHSLSNGLRTRDNNIIYGVDQGYAKGISWGDIEALSEAPPLEIGNYVWIDDGDGVQEAGETPVTGATVRLYEDANGNGRLDGGEPLVATTTTDSNGQYLFDLDDGIDYYTDYIITMDNAPDYGAGGALSGFLPTAANAAASDNLDSDAVDPGSGFPEIAVRVGNFGETDHSYDFGFIQTVSVGNLVWIDLNSDGDVDPGEPGLAGATVSLYLDDGVTPASDTSGQLVAPQVTGPDGGYLFSGLADGTYVVKVTPPAGFTPTAVAAQPDPDLDSTDDDSNGTGSGPAVQTPPFSLTQGGETPGDEDGDGSTYSDLTVDFGFEPDAVMVGSYVWTDSDGDGDQIGESGLAGAIVELYLSSGFPAVDTAGGPVPSQTTGSDGSYLFTGLPDGDYIVRVTPPANYAPTQIPGDPDPDSNPSDTDSNGVSGGAPYVESPVVSLAAGTEVAAGGDLDPSVDFGFVLQLFDIACSSSADGGPVNPGDTITYTIEVTNTSGAELTGVNVINPLPSGTTYVTDSVNVTGAAGGGGPTVQTFDFESGDQAFTLTSGGGGQEWERGTPSAGPGGAHGGSNAWGTDLDNSYQNNVSQMCLVSPTFDFTGQSNVEIKFWEWLEVENQGFDGAAFQRSVGAGPWTTIFDTTGGPERVDTAWSEFVHDASAYAGGQSSVRWRWCLSTDGSVVYDGWYIDDVVVTSSAAATVSNSLTFAFADGQMPAAWVQAGATGNAPGTNWNVGTPTVGADGLTPFNDTFVLGTNIGSNYTSNIPTPGVCIETQAFDFTGKSNVEIDYVLNANTQNNFAGADPFRFQYNDGSGWQDVFSNFAGTTNGSWVAWNSNDPAALGGAHDPSAYADGNATVRWRWCLQSNGATTAAGLYLDNIVISWEEPAISGPTTDAPPNLVTGATIADGDTMTVTFQVTVNTPPGVNEIVSTTSIDSDQTTASFTCSLTDLVNVPRDFADAPDTGAGTGAGNYSTLASDNGPSHIIDAAIKIGASTDAEGGTLQNGDATADGADEDGVNTADLASLQKTLPAEVDVAVTNTTGSAAVLYGWIDFDSDGVFAATERALVNVPNGTNAGTFTLDFGTVPTDAAMSTFARFRLSTDPASASPTGAADNGEVEDYAVAILDAPLYDYGDLPDLASGTGAGDYQTRVADGGARHIIVAGLTLGDDVDDELNGAPSTAADGDNGTRRNDEEGIVLSDLSVLEGFPADVRAVATNTTGAAANLYGFIDWDGDGSFGGANETASAVVPDGSNGAVVTLAFGSVPAGSAANPYARFRLSTDPAAASASGTASDGEVEDYVASVTVPAYDYGDAADTGGSTYDTLLASDGPRHVLGAGLTLGSEVDADSDGQQSLNADGDDNGDADDEDGLPSGLTLTESGSGLVAVAVTNPLGQDATLYGWIDLNDNGVFEAGEGATAIVPQGTNGAVDLDFGTIPTSTAGTHVIRLRLSTDTAAQSPTGAALDGEVEDHLVTIVSTSVDFGDAPDTGGGDYNTLLASDGPRHVLANGLQIGAAVDAEPDGAQSPDALGDDAAGSPDDEDGLTVSLVAGGSALFEVAVVNPMGSEASLYGWIDFDGNGTFDLVERASATVAGGTNGTVVLDFGTVPITAVASTFLRLRLSTDAAAASSPDGVATDGEVEDHAVSIEPATFDYADAPDTGAGTGPANYETLAADNGPAHVLSNGLKLGVSVDDETDANQSSGADGDDLDEFDDENGIATAIALYEGLGATLEVAVMNPLVIDASLYGWVDFNGNGVFEAGERADVVVPAGSNGTVVLDFGAVPSGSASATFTRLRLSSDDAAASAPTGVAFDGEVEDYPVAISVPQFDYGDAPSASGYETLAADDGARHLLAGNGVFIGAEVDDEADGQPNSTASGDDGVDSPDDEDGIAGTLLLREGTFASVDVPVTNTSGADAVLWTWVDWNGDGDFSIAERFRTAVPDGTLSANPVSVSFGVIPAGTAGDTFLRLRLTTDRVLNSPNGSFGSAFDGEIEDHPVTIDPPQYDFGDAASTYGTTLALDGANHTLLGDGLVIGATVDDEADGQPGAVAAGDGGDEDGLGAFTLYVGGSGLVPVTVQNPTPSTATLFGWIDFDNSGMFEPGERASVVVPAGTSGPVVLDFGTIPAGFTGTTTARLRLSSAPPAGNPNGNAVGGEVEDHQVTIADPTYDWGDAPDGSYATLDASGGPNHVITPEVKIGATTDNESDGQPNGSASGDGGDEDGVNTSDLSLTIGIAADVRVTATNTSGSPAKLVGWIDFNADGFFDNASERADVSVPTGSNAVEFVLPFGSVPSGATIGTTFARFRLSTDAAAYDPVGAAADGEVEDYQATIASVVVYDYGDALDAYSTLDGSGGPRHALGSDLRLGALVDAETDGQPNAGADGDDANGDADEDGVDLADLDLLHGATALIDVTATNQTGSAATLYGFFDLDGDGTFETTDSVAVPDGTIAGGFQLDFGTVGTGFTGTTYARFRLSTDAAAANPGGTASDGEIEDYVLTIAEPPSYDYGDAPEADGYDTLAASGGPSHLLGSSISIGASVDADNGLLENSGATADDSADSADEDGVVTVAQLSMVDNQAAPEIDVSVVNNTGDPAVLFGWIDFNGDGVFDNGSERASANVPHSTSGMVTLTFPDVPATATADTGGTSYLRLRLSTDTAGAASATGTADDGEVEDHQVTFQDAVGIGNLVFRDLNGDGAFDADGVNDNPSDGDDETGIDSVVVELWTTAVPPGGGGSALATTTTSGGGHYYFGGLKPDTYIVHIPGAEFGAGKPLANLASSTGAGGDSGNDDDADENGLDNADPENGGISSVGIVLTRGSEPEDAGSETGEDSASDSAGDDNNDLTVDFGFVSPAAGIGNLVFNDVNGDGIFDADGVNDSAGDGDDETGIDGVIIELYDAEDPAHDEPGIDTPIASTTTANGGCYFFGGLADGNYIVHIPASEFGASEPLENLFSSAGSGIDDGLDDNVDENGVDALAPATTGMSSVAIALQSGTEPTSGSSESGKDNSADGSSADANADLTIDFAFTTGAQALGNLVFIDANSNGVYDSGEGIDDVIVGLWDPVDGTIGNGDDVQVGSFTNTADGGCYVFSGLAPGDYYVSIPASEFGSGEPLEGALSVLGTQTGDDDAGEDGIDDSDPAANGIHSNVITLAVDSEPTDGGAGALAETGKDNTSDNGDDANTNLTVDFGFTLSSTTTNCVFRDTNGNGTFDAEEFGIAGVTVTAYYATGTPLAQVVTDANGQYDLGLASGIDLRVVYSNLPAPFIPSPTGAGTLTVFTQSDSDFKLPLIGPADACELNPIVFTPCYINGDPGTPSSPTTAGVLDAIVAFRFDDSGTSTTNKKTLASAAEVGSTWGAAYDRERDYAYFATVVRRHVSLGPGADGTPGTADDIGAIYRIDTTDLDNPVVDTLITIPSTNPGGYSLDNASRGLSGIVSDSPSNDLPGYQATGRAGLGDIDISADSNTLYAVNVGGQDLVTIDLTGASASITSSLDIYDTAPASVTAICAKTEFRPWAVKVLGSEIYVGAVCSGENGGTLAAFILQLNATATGFDEVYQYNLPLSGRDTAWTRPDSAFGSFDDSVRAATLAATQWKPWLGEAASTWPADTVVDPFFTGENFVIHAQPMLADIEFDSAGNIILGFNDRQAMVGGYNNYKPSGTETVQSVGAGDIIRVQNTPGGYVVDSSEFYTGDSWSTDTYTEHLETAFGSLAVRPHTSEIMVTVYDPIDGDGNYTAGGTKRLSITDGSVVDRFQIYDLSSAGVTFGKAAGLGDLELGCELPLVVGNRVFDDLDGDGVQEPGEPGIANVSISIYTKDGVLVGTTTTADDPGNDNAIEGTWVSPELMSNTEYLAVIDASAFQMGGALFGRQGTQADQGADDLDSDLQFLDDLSGALAGFNGGFGYYFTTGDESDYTIDFGVEDAKPVAVGNLVYSDDNLDGVYTNETDDSGIDQVTLELYQFGDTPGVDAPVDTTVTANGGCYALFAPGPGAFFVHIPAAEINGGDLNGFDSLPGAGVGQDIDDSTDENGIDDSNASINGISSNPVYLYAGSEPSGAVENGKLGSQDAIGLSDPDGVLTAAADADVNLTVDFAFVDPAFLPGVGNLVWIEGGTPDGIYTAGIDTPVDGVLVELYEIGDDPESTSPVTSTTTSGGGCYVLRATPGTYFVHLPKENFDDSSDPLYQVHSVTGNGGDDQSDDNIASLADNGIDAVSPAATGIRSVSINLAAGTEPSGVTEGGKDGTGDDPSDTNTDYTIDFGFVSSVAVAQICIEDTPGAEIVIPNDTSFLDRTLALDAAGAGCTISKVTLGLKIRGTNTGDSNALDRTVMEAYLTSPDGLTTVTLADVTPLYGGGASPGRANINVLFDDAASTDWGTAAFEVSAHDMAAAYAARTYQPTGTLGDFMAQEGEGDWNLRLIRRSGGTYFAHSYVSAELCIECESASDKVGVGNLVFIESGATPGYQSGEDTPVPGVTVELFNGSTVVASAVTDDSGCYTFVTDPGATYSVRLPASNFQGGGPLNGIASSVVDAGIAPVDSADGSSQIDDDADENGLDPSPNTLASLQASGITSGVFALEAGTEPGSTNETGKGSAADDGSTESNVDLTIDFGFTPSAVGVGNLVFNDLNKNGTYDSGEGIDGVIVDLWDPVDGTIGNGDDVPVGSSTITADGGCYLFSGLAPGDYYVRIPASEFGSGELLEGALSVLGTQTGDDDAGEDGIDDSDPAANGIHSNVITLAFDSEPTDGGAGALAETGKDNTSDNASDANTDLTIDFGFVFSTPLVAVGNRVWIDSTANSIYDSGEGVNQVTVELYHSGQEPGQHVPLASTTTDANGHYQFDEINEGDYILYIPASAFATGALAGVSPLPGAGVDDGKDETIDENGQDIFTRGGIASGVVHLTAGSEPQSESSQSSYTGTLPDDSVDMTIDFAFAAPSGAVAIGDVIWIDDGTANGTFDPGEGEDGVVVELYEDANTPGVDEPLRRTVTSNGGCYLFDQLAEGTYIVHIPASEFTEGPLAGTTSLSGAGGDDANDDDVDENGLDTLFQGGVSTAPIALAAGDEPESDNDTKYSGSLPDNAVNLTVDFGFEAPTGGKVALGSRVYADANGDGDFDPGEGAEGICVALYTSGQTPGVDTPVKETITGTDGAYLFDQLEPDTYVVYIPAKAFAYGPLAGATSLPGQDTAAIDEGSPNNDNGSDSPIRGGTVSNAVTLAVDGAPELEATQVDYTGTLDDNDVDMTVDLGFIPHEPDPALGNVVFIDADRDGVFDVGEGVNGVAVELYTSDQEPGVDAPIRQTTTLSDGNYLFDLLPDGAYRVYIPASEFGPGEPLFGYESLPGAGGDDTNDDDADENGLDTLLNGGIVSAIILVTEGGEPTNESGSSTGPTSVLGDDSVNMTIDFGFWIQPPAGAIGNYVWIDENSDGYQNVGEHGVPNVVLQLKDDNGILLATTVSDADGGYLFDELPAGTFLVDVDESTLPTGLTQTTPSTLPHADGGNQDHGGLGYPVTIGGTEPWVDLTADFGYNWNPDTDVNTPSGSETAAIGDTVWYDTNGNGVQDPGEAGIAGATVTLHAPGPDLIFHTADDVEEASTTTDALGSYLFDGLAPGAYCVKVESDQGPIIGLTQTGDPDHFGVPWPGGSVDDHETTVPIILGPGDVFLNADFGYNAGTVGSIGDTVWIDLDADGTGASIAPVDGGASETQGDVTGTADVSETTQGIPGVTVSLAQDTNGNGLHDQGEPFLVTTITDGNGQYLFTGLPLDDGGGDSDADYIVVVTDTNHVLQGLSQTWDRDGVLGTPGKSAVAISAGTPDVRTEDFGYTPGDPSGSIGDYVWLDTDVEGDQDEPRSGLPGVAVQLLDANGTVVRTTATNSAGYYLFDRLPLDSYQVRVAADNFSSGQPLYKHSNTEDPDGDDDNEGNLIALTHAAPHQRAQDFGYDTDGTQLTGDPVGSIGDTIWFDRDGSGGDQSTQGSEPGLPCVLVRLYEDDGDGLFEPETDDLLVGEQYTNGQGNYLFTGLPLDTTYFVQVETNSLPPHVDPAGTYEETANGETTSGNSVSDATPTVATPHVRDQDFSYEPFVAATDIGSIGDFVWFDENSSGGNQAASSGESGLGGVTVILLDHTGTEIARRTTDPTGYYLFDGLALDDGADGDNDADYTVAVDVTTLPSFVSRTASYSQASASLTTAAPHDRDEDFSYPPATALGAIGDYVWLDADGGNDQNELGSGIQSVLVELLDHHSNVIATTTTDAHGYYGFTGLPLDDGADGDNDADYQVRVADENFLPGAVLENLSHTGTAANGPAGDTLATVSLTNGAAVNLAQDFGYRGETTQGTIGNLVWLDANADGIWDGIDGPDGTASTDDDEPLIAGVTIDLYRDLDGDGLLEPGEPRVGTTTTDGFVSTTSSDDGNYLFTGLAVDVSYIVDVTDTASVLNGYWQSLGTVATTGQSQIDPYGSLALTTAAPENLTADFGYYKDLAQIGNRAWIDANDNGDQDSGEMGLNGVEVTLLITYPSGATVTAKTVTADEPVTGEAGAYTFGVLADEDYASGSGSATTPAVGQPAYQLSAHTPDGYVIAQVDSGTNDQLDSDDHAGVAATPTQGLTNVTLAPAAPDNEGDPIASYDFGYQIDDSKADTWSAFLTDNGLSGDDALPQPTGALPEAGNPDKDIYDNLLEYAFCLDPNDPIPAFPPFCAEVNTSGDPDTFEAVFYRPAGGLTDVTYCLEGRTTLPTTGDTTWVQLTVVPGSGGPGAGVTVTDLGNGLEEVRIADITAVATTGDTLLGFEDAEARGFVRLTVKLDTDGGGTDFTSHTQVQGWKQTDCGQNQCASFSHPWLQKEAFSGAVASVSGQELTMTGTPDLSNVLVPGSSYYLEILSGDNEGHRFDVVSANASGVITLAPDNDLCAGPPFNTSTTLPANLAEDRFAVRAHQTAEGLFPAAALTPEADPSLADRLLIYEGGNIPWKVLYVDDPVEWKNEGTGAAAGNDVLAPHQGYFVHPKLGALTVLGMGVVRANTFRCPLGEGYRMVANGFPIDASFADRGLNDTVNQVTGSLDPATADQVHFWNGDGSVYSESFTGHFRLEGSILGLPPFAQWSDVQDVNLDDTSNEKVFKADRSVFYHRVTSGCDIEHRHPLPWAP